MRPARSIAVAEFAVRANLRSGLAIGGLAAFAAIAMLGPVASLRNGNGWVLDADLLFYGYLTGGLFFLRSGLEQQREAGLQTYLRHNFCTPLEHALGAVLSLMGSWLILTAALWLAGLLGSAGDLATATWYAWAFGLALAVLLPFVLVVESTATLRLPLILPVIGYFTLAIVLALTLGEVRMAELLGFTVERGDLSSSLRLAGRVAVVLPVGMALYLAGVALRSRRHGAPTAVP